MLQYQHANSVQIHGLPEADNEIITEVLSKISSTTGFNFKDKILDAAHLLSGIHRLNKS